MSDSVRGKGIWSIIIAVIEYTLTYDYNTMSSEDIHIEGIEGERG